LSLVASHIWCGIINRAHQVVVISQLDEISD
jgi:hypothetical protein